MKPHIHRRDVRQLGSTLIELMLVIAILSIVTGAILSQLGTASQRIGAEQVKVDNFDQARDFVDQFFRDINQIGYPNGHIVNNIVTVPPANDARVAVGLVKITATSVWFEGDINGSGIVQSVQYMINGSGTCALCLQRSAIPKVTGTAPLAQGPADWGTEVNDLTTPIIFTYFDTNGVAVPVPADITNNPTVIASVKTIHISLTIQNNNVIDQKTGQPIQTSFEGEVSLNNCSLAAGGAMTC